MARPESQRKALRTAFRLIGLGVVSAVVSVPLAFTSTILMNPLLGRLEARYGVELTGHSGPADWIFEIGVCGDHHRPARHAAAGDAHALCRAA